MRLLPDFRSRIGTARCLSVLQAEMVPWITIELEVLDGIAAGVVDGTGVWLGGRGETRGWEYVFLVFGMKIVAVGGPGFWWCWGQVK